MTDVIERIREALAALDGPQTAGTSMAVNAEYAQACNPAAIRELLAEMDRLRARLEVDPHHSIDGITARDATIREQDKEIERLRAALVGISEARYTLVAQAARLNEDAFHAGYAQKGRNRTAANNAWDLRERAARSLYESIDAIKAHADAALGEQK